MIHDPYISKSHRHTELYKTVKYAVFPSLDSLFHLTSVLPGEFTYSFLKLHPFTSVVPHSWHNAMGVEVISEDSS